VVVGAGILGLAVARELTLRRPGLPVTVLDKEPDVAVHQTGRNSGVVHAGLYYRPGSLKAVLCRRGGALLREYCAEHGVPFAELGKLVVASTRDDVGGLLAIEERARANDVPGLRLLGPRGLRDVEPWVVGVAALHSPHTAATDYVAVCRALADDVRRAGGQVLLGREVLGVEEGAAGIRLQLAGGELRCSAAVVCAGLAGDRVAAGLGAPGAGGRRGPARTRRGAGDLRIMPFRGEYRRLVGPARDKVAGMVYPVPDPRYPFLGVHLTRRVDGEVLVGPNAVLATAREGYRRRDVDARDVGDLLTWPGTWHLARRSWRTGLAEAAASLSDGAFLRSARRFVPSLRAPDLAPAPAGVRAQAVARDGTLLDDFAIDVSGRVVAVRNAPSPGATSSLAIAEHIVDRVVEATG
jgi:L-2-hydroxyglutarate oxidase LhgO